MTTRALSLSRLFLDRTTDRSAHRPATRMLARHALLRVQQPLGRTVRCGSGSLWLSFDGDPRDVILAAGQAHRCDRNSLLLVEGLENARLGIE